MGEPLHQAEKQQRDRGIQADALVIRDQRNAQAAERQQEHGEHHDGPASQSVAQSAKQPTAHRACDKANRKHGKRREHRRARIGLVEQVACQVHRKGCVQGPVKPFKRIADTCCAQRFEASLVRRRIVHEVSPDYGQIEAL
jgi:hypothetical protein